MKKAFSYAVARCIAGVLVIAPIYLACILLLKGVKTMLGLMAPVAKMLPQSVPAENAIALIILLFLCLLVGVAIQTAAGRNVRASLERSIFRKIPGYSLLQSLTLQVADAKDEKNDEAWESALVEIEDALVPGFIIETLADGRLTVFVPSVPTPMAGAVYILTPDRVHRTGVPFRQAVMVITKWGAGCKDLVAAMKPAEKQSTLPLSSATTELARISEMAKRNPGEPGTA